MLKGLVYWLPLLCYTVLARPNVSPTSFVLVGDSTTANGTVLDSGGWGDGFCGGFLPIELVNSSLAPDTPCINTAENGATTGSFVADGFWNISLAAMQGEVAKGRRTLVTVQFGHNDMKIAPPESMGANLTVMVQQIRAVGAEPVLVTSLTRRNFNADGTIDDALGPWANETILISQASLPYRLQQNTHLLDLHAASITYVEEIGPDAAHRLNRSPDDNTHLNINGTIVFGRPVPSCIVKSLQFILP
ncbi:carbohydrate esterase family 12 protein [Collybiopsis luxurians FD-317 M1]|uniref:Carbohydrate esterase family 12 protein n=1 Tax=Collybiopsis luxurians FD-317 M1 TaxID=944289 RepID=A0A0D0D1L2_9AGAR|nr:carbohydrate esterase family 12 protein [Collybiopsis luxurians FD-317 M1]